MKTYTAKSSAKRAVIANVVAKSNVPESVLKERFDELFFYQEFETGFLAIAKGDDHSETALDALIAEYEPKPEPIQTAAEAPVAIIPIKLSQEQGAALLAVINADEKAQRDGLLANQDLAPIETAELPEENDCRRPVTFDEAGNAIDPLTALGGLIQPQDKITVVPGGMAIELHEETDSKLRKSLIERPCKEVWNISEELHTANPQIKRREVLEECTKRGIAYYTARTQYQEWMRACKEMHTREAQTAAKK